VTRDVRLMFTTASGSALNRGMWSEIWRPAARAAGLPPRTGLHCPRHWYASALISGGGSIKTVQKRLGHSSPVVTLSVYAHLMPDADDRTRDAVVAALQDRADSVRTAHR
jgi:integrase